MSRTSRSCSGRLVGRLSAAAARPAPGRWVRWPVLALAAHVVLGGLGLLRGQHGVIPQPHRFGHGVLREPHLRLDRQEARQREAAQGPVYARWFIPGELGYEPGEAPAGPRPTAFLTRAMSLGGGAEREAWAEENGLTPRLAFSHNLSRIIPATLFDERPELFPEINGERWRPEPGRLNWNPDLGGPATAAYAAAAARAYFEENPEAVSFALGVNDGLRFGESAATREWVTPVRWFRQRPDYSDLVFTFMNRVAAEVSPAWPDKHLGALAYYWSENVPGFPVHPQVLPFLTADRSQSYDRTFDREERALQRAWGRAGPVRLGLYDYLYGMGFLVPRQFPHAIARHLRHARASGFTDYYAEVYPNWGLDGPQPWLVAQLLQDPHRPVEALLDEYYRRYFRAAAVPMRRFFAACEQIWSDQPGPAYWLKHYRNDSQAALFPPEVCARLRQHLDAAARAADGDATVAARVELVSAAFGVTERFARLDQVRDALAREILIPLEAKTSAGTSAGAASRHLSEYQAARADLIAYVADLARTHPLALHSHLLDDFLRHDPGPTAEALRDWSDRTTERQNGGAAAGRSEGDGGVPRQVELDFGGALEPALEIAGLPYTVAAPASWGSTVEPWQGLVARWHGPAEDRVLRLEQNKLTTLYRWLPATGGETVEVGLRVRGLVGATTIVGVGVAWLDAQHQRLGPTVDVRVPEGAWPEWVLLRHAAQAPADARWLGVLIWVAHQQPGEWLEIGATGRREGADALRMVDR